MDKLITFDQFVNPLSRVRHVHVDLSLAIEGAIAHSHAIDGEERRIRRTKSDIRRFCMFGNLGPAGTITKLVEKFASECVADENKLSEQALIISLRNAKYFAAVIDNIFDELESRRKEKIRANNENRRLEKRKVNCQKKNTKIAAG